MLHLYAAEIQASKKNPRKYISNIWSVGDVAAPNGLIFWEKTLFIADYKWIEVWHWESEPQSNPFLPSLKCLDPHKWKLENLRRRFWWCACYIKPYLPGYWNGCFCLWQPTPGHICHTQSRLFTLPFSVTVMYLASRGGRDEAIRNTMRLIDIRFSHHLQLILEAEIQPGTRSEQ